MERFWPRNLGSCRKARFCGAGNDVKMSVVGIQLTSSSDLFKQFPELYGEVNSIIYFGFGMFVSLIKMLYLISMSVNGMETLSPSNIILIKETLQ